jgi:hypothetical protein
MMRIRHCFKNIGVQQTIFGVNPTYSCCSSKASVVSLVFVKNTTRARGGLMSRVAVNGNTQRVTETFKAFSTKENLAKKNQRYIFWKLKSFLEHSGYFFH